MRVGAFPDFNKRWSEQLLELEETRLMEHLVFVRRARGMSVKDVARKMGVEAGLVEYMEKDPVFGARYVWAYALVIGAVIRSNVVFYDEDGVEHEA